MAYPNGQWPDSALTIAEDNDRLAPAAAAAFRAFKAYAASLGRNLQIAEPAGAYRSLAVQRGMKSHPEKYNLNPASSAKLAPVGKSGHGDGDCVDLVGTALVWIVANAGRFGFSRPLANDPNHFRHNGTVSAGSGSASLHSKGSTEMLYFYYNGTVASAVGATIAVNPSNGDSRYLSKWERAALGNEVAAGRALSNPLADAEWEQLARDTHPPYTIQQIADAVDGVIDDEKLVEAVQSIEVGQSSPVDVNQLALSLAPLLHSVTKEELDAALESLDITIGGK